MIVIFTETIFGSTCLKWAYVRGTRRGLIPPPPVALSGDSGPSDLVSAWSWVGSIELQARIAG